MKNRSPAGFTLIEVMVAAALLGIGLAAILSSMSSSKDFMIHQRHLGQTIHVAEAMMEMQLVKVPSDADMQPGTFVGPKFSALGEISATGIYRTSWTVAMAAPPVQNMRRVTVRVEWDEPSGTKELSITSLRN